MNMTTKSPSSSSRRRRPTFACEPCRRKKIKCDRNTPCNQCSRTKSEYCVYLPNEDNGFRQPCHGIMKRSHISRNRQSSKGHGVTHGALRVNASQRPTFEKSHSPVSGASTPTQHTLDEEWQDDHMDAASEHLSLRGVFVDSQFFGPSHWMSSIVHFHKVHAIQRAYKDGPGSQIYSQCRDLGGFVTQNNTPPLTCALQSLVPEREISEQLIQAYLRTFESVLRILHVPTFLVQCQRFWKRPEDTTSEFTLQLLMVLAIGATFTPKLDTSRHDPLNWISAVENAFRLLEEKSRASIKGLQTLCLILLARQVNPIAAGADLAGISADCLWRVATKIGLHIDGRLGPKRSFYEQEIRRRLWATVLELTLQSSMALGVPPIMSTHEVDFDLPLNVADEQFDEQTTISPEPKPADRLTHTSHQIALMKSFPVRLEIACFVNDPHTEGSYKEALQLSVQLSSHYNTHCVPFDGETKHQSLRFADRLMDMLMHRFLLALHAPFALRANLDPTLYFSRKMGLETALSILDRCLESDDDDYTRAMSMGNGIFDSTPILAASIIGAELLGQLEGGSPNFSYISGYEGQGPLRKAFDKLLDLLSKRIRFGKPNIDAFILCAGLKAQIDASIAGQSPDVAISAALETHLSQALDWLQERMSSLHIFDSLFESVDPTLMSDGLNWDNPLGTQDYWATNAVGDSHGILSAS
ncbi:uncharacterized protein RCC_07551 [Ramularia collo-cygni]|uniref:Zn(2)-C6 fungal-type domain-containing protein n=1 Tax=Ramularia collo-cygni TaxID=112498 RepID=A0A2D3VD33_9PEZI|nr:uncharacterized protein RCC_07551 [Ramularia collo-cygni]CZT21686.1 uncharacterized protein RCC_07551 [Ramularia collo-cygni]